MSDRDRLDPARYEYEQAEQETRAEGRPVPPYRVRRVVVMLDVVGPVGAKSSRQWLRVRDELWDALNATTFGVPEYWHRAYTVAVASISDPQLDT